MKRALILQGGWAGHRPATIAAWAAATLFDGFDVTTETDLGALDHQHLAEYDVLCPVWTFGDLTAVQEDALMAAVAGGLGLVCWHGHTSAFLSSRPHKHLLGGQFVAHPGGDHVDHVIRFGDHPLVAGLADVAVCSEQYYLLVDPAVTVLATTTIVAADQPWLAGVEMPAAWIRPWGDGRVAYTSLGHSLTELRDLAVTELLRRAVRWVARPQAER